MDRQRVLELRTNEVGVQVGAKVFKSLTEKDEVAMNTHPAGVYVIHKPKLGAETHFIVPYANCSSIKVEAPPLANGTPKAGK